MNNKTSTSLSILAALFTSMGLVAASFSTATAATDAPTLAEQELAVVAPMYLQLEITSSCTNKGSVFKIINRGKKWPRQGILRVYYSDDKSVMTERRLRLAANQKVSFVISKEKSTGRPVGVWIEPEWYKREFGYDAKSSC